MPRPAKGLLQRLPSLLVVLLFFAALAGYTLFLQQRLSIDAEPRIMRMHGNGGGLSDQSMHMQYELERVAGKTEDGRDGDGGSASAAALVQKTAKLASEVAGLAWELEEKQDRLQKHQVVRPLLVDKDQRQQQQQVQRQQQHGQQRADGQVKQEMQQRQQQQQQQQQQHRQKESGQVAKAADAAAAPAAEDWEGRRQAVVAAMRHAWGGYVKYAWGHDELDPVGKIGRNDFGGVGATIVDSLDTLWLMGLEAECAAARDWTAHNLTFHQDHDSSVFETTIRVVGGLLAAHDLSGDAMFARKAQEIGDILMRAFDTPTGIPHGTINLKSLRSYNPSWAGGASGLAEFGSEQLEFIKLSDWTGNGTYARIVEGNVALMHQKHPDRGLLPYYISTQDGALMNNAITFGAMGDSYYEYLVKVWLLKGASDEMYRSMWEAAMDEMAAKLIFSSKKTGLTYIAELQSGRPYHKMDHLACFAPAMLALGAKYGAVKGAKAEQYMQLAVNLTETCYQMYARQPTGLAPELVMFSGEDMSPGAAHNLLRPETVEALFVLWRTTGDAKYRRQGWAIFQAFEKHCRVEAGYAGLRDVTQLPPQHDDKQQSFFLAETLKYLFLLFGPNDVLPLDQWVLNTEAHPLRKVPNFKSTYRTAAAAAA